MLDKKIEVGKKYFLAHFCIIFHSKHAQIILHYVVFNEQQLFVCLFKGMLKPDSVLLMLLLPSVKHLVLAICVSLPCAACYTLAEANLVICRLAKCESRLEKSFCNASSETPKGTGGWGQGGFYWGRLCAFLFLQTISLHCRYIRRYKYICQITFTFKFTGGQV